MVIRVLYIRSLEAAVEFSKNSNLFIFEIRDYEKKGEKNE